MGEIISPGYVDSETKRIQAEMRRAQEAGDNEEMDRLAQDLQRLGGLEASGH